MLMRLRSGTRANELTPAARGALHAWKRWLCASAVAVVATTVIAATVFACSSIMGQLTLNPQSGPPGAVVMTSVTGLKPYPAKYELFFGGQCMTFTGKLLKTITTDANGAWTNVAVTIPKRAKLGSHSLCGVEAYPVAGQTATSHNSFTVV